MSNPEQPTSWQREATEVYTPFLRGVLARAAFVALNEARQDNLSDELTQRAVEVSVDTEIAKNQRAAETLRHTLTPRQE